MVLVKFIQVVIHTLVSSTSQSTYIGIKTYMQIHILLLAILHTYIYIYVNWLLMVYQTVFISDVLGSEIFPPKFSDSPKMLAET